MSIGEPRELREPRLSPREEIQQQIEDIEERMKEDKGVDKETMKAWEKKKKELEIELSKLEEE